MPHLLALGLYQQQISSLGKHFSYMRILAHPKAIPSKQLYN